MCLRQGRGLSRVKGKMKPGVTSQTGGAYDWERGPRPGQNPPQVTNRPPRTR